MRRDGSVIVAHRPISLLLTISCLSACWSCLAQEAQLNRGNDYFQSRVEALERKTASDLKSITAENWDRKRVQWRQELSEMLGLTNHPRKAIEAYEMGKKIDPYRVKDIAEERIRILQNALRAAGRTLESD